MVIHRLNTNKRPCYNLQCRICQSLPTSELLEDFQQLWGGSIQPYKRGRGGFEWVVTGARAAKFVRDVAPYSRVKRDQMELALKFAEHAEEHNIRSLAHTQGIDEAIIERILNERQDMREKMQALKQVDG